MGSEKKGWERKVRNEKRFERKVSQVSEGNQRKVKGRRLRIEKERGGEIYRRGRERKEG